MILKLNMLISLVFVSLLLSCTVPVKNNEFCADMGVDGAACFHTLSKDSRDLKKADWDKARFGMICESTDVFANIKDIIDTLCQNSGQCTYEQQQAEAQFFDKLNTSQKLSHP